MNYSKDSTNAKNESTKQQNKKKKSVKKTKVIAFRIFMISIIIGIFALLGAGIGIFMGILDSAPDISNLELKPTTNYTSFLYDQNGVEIDRVSVGENRIYATLDQIPKYLQDAVVAVEDERFWEHNGIDVKGILRALVVNIQTGSFSEGASTITQQLIKNNILTPDKTISRKIQEQFLALQFEQAYTETYGKVGAKEIILEYYLNTMHLGNSNNGVQAAANFYFNKDVADLSLRESVVLAGITQYPGYYDPIKNPENNHEKALVILDKMIEQGMITEADKAAALEEDPYTDIASVHKSMDTSSQTYFVDAVIAQVIEDLQEHSGMTMVQANNMVYGGGISIYTTLDQDMQAIVDKHMNNDSLFPSTVEYMIDYTASIEKADGSIVHRGAQGIIKSEADIQTFIDSRHEDWGVTAQDTILNPVHTLTPQAQASFVVMDHNNGHVKALSGGRGEKTGSRTFNRATDAERQPGSAFKVLASYAPALDMGLLSPGSVLIDEETAFGSGSKPYIPKNWYNGFRGPVTVREGVFDSLNIIAVQALEQVGFNNAYDYLTNFGFTTLTDQDKVYALALGGVTTGVTTLELTGAYAAIANQGVYTEPILYTQVKDREGNIILDNSVPNTHAVIKSSTASMLTDMMQDTVTEGTGVRIGRTFSSQPVAGKTGTTSDDKDFVFAGYTPYYTASVWMGYDNPKSFNNSSNSHLTLWATIMNEIHQQKNLPRGTFEMDTTGYTRMSVCSASGMLVGDLCSSSGATISTDYFLKDSIPSHTCNAHAVMKMCNISGKIATEFCPLDTVSNKVTSQGNSTQVKPEDLCPIHTEPVITEEPESDGWPFPDIFNPFAPDESEDLNELIDPSENLEESTDNTDNTDNTGTTDNNSDASDDFIPDPLEEEPFTEDASSEEPTTDDSNGVIPPPEPSLDDTSSNPDDESDFYIPQG